MPGMLAGKAGVSGGETAMRTAIYREDPAAFLRSMVWVAVGSFVAGFSGFLLVGANIIG